MAYTLYYTPGACSLAVHVLLKELGQDATYINVAQDQPGRNQFLALNPRGTVPTLMDGDFMIREGGAILSYLCDTHKSKLLPASGKERATALEWLMFCNSTLHPQYGRGFGAKKGMTGELQKETLLRAEEQINKHWQDVEAHLKNQPYLAGSEITVGDILLTVIANWSGNFPGVALGPKAKALFKRVSDRPSFQAALAEEQVTYKVAA